MNSSEKQTKICIRRLDAILFTSTNRWLMIICGIILIFTVYLIGCAVFTKTIPEGKETSKLFYKGYNDTWNAVISALGTTPLEIVDKHNGFIKTGWIEGRSGRETSGLFLEAHWKERYRLLISIISMSALDARTEISIVTHSEEKAPAGLQASNWKRKASDGRLEYHLLEEVERLLIRVKEFETPQQLPNSLTP